MLIFLQQCGLSVDKRRCERCPRCRTWIDTSTSSTTRRTSGEFRDGGSFCGREGHSSSAYDDASDQHRRLHRRSVGGYDDYENDRNNYYSRPSDRGPGRSRGGGDGNDYHYDRDRDHDGPRKKKRDNYHNNDEGNDFLRKTKRAWPPCFESSGAAFIFDARSGMFYEPSSDFFYDPKTKLYYSNVRQQYFRYDVDKAPNAFQPVGGDDSHATAATGAAQPSVHGIITPKVVTEVEEVSTESSPTGLVVATLSTPDKAESKQKIAISLKTPLPPKDPSIKSLNDVAAMEKVKLNEKNLQRKESASSASGGAAVPQAHKKHALDMSKWSERVKEMREEGNITDAQQPPSTISSEVKTTASGQPMCVLCRRKFANVEKLRQHEKLSTLHKENLAKRAASASAPDAASNITTDALLAKKEGGDDSDVAYRDRSKERRLMYGAHVPTQSSHAEALLAHSLDPSSTSTTSSDAKHTQVIRPEETLNDTNVGNKLLQKLGWKSGETLGRNAKDGSGANEDVVSNNLRSDWERIESLAQGGGRKI